MLFDVKWKTCSFNRTNSLHPTMLINAVLLCHASFICDLSLTHKSHICRIFVSFTSFVFDHLWFFFVASCKCAPLVSTTRHMNLSEWCASYSYLYLYLFRTPYRFILNNGLVFSCILLFIIPLDCTLHFCSGAYLFQGHDLCVSVMLRCSIAPSSLSLWSMVSGIGFLLYLCYNSEGCSKGSVS